MRDDHLRPRERAWLSRRGSDLVDERYRLMDYVMDITRQLFEEWAEEGVNERFDVKAEARDALMSLGAFLPEEDADELIECVVDRFEEADPQSTRLH
jgi:hypothetical protein